MKPGIELIIEERKEQIEKHGYTALHDDEFESDGKLVMAAEAAIDGDDGDFPAHWEAGAINRICSKPYKERLIIGGALYLAERERIDRRIKEIAAEIDKLNNAALNKGGVE